MDEATRKQRYEELVAATKKRISLTGDPLARARLEKALGDIEALELKAADLRVKLKHIAAENEQPASIFRVNWLFRTNASRREKVFTLSTLGWCGLAVYGMTNSFVPAPGVDEMAAYAALPVSLCFFLPLFFDRHPSNNMRTFGFLKRATIYLILLAFCYGVSWATLALGGPSLATRVFGRDFVGEYRVTWKSDGKSRRGQCDHAFRLQEVRSQWDTKTCVDEELWASTKPGDIIFATGRRSWLGAILLETMREAPSEAVPPARNT